MSTLDASIISAPLATPISAPRVTDALTRTTITPRVAPAIERRQLWQRQYRTRLATVDTLAVLTASGLAAWLQISAIAQVELLAAPWQYGRVFIITVAIWLMCLGLFQTRASKITGSGTLEYRRVAHATGMAFGILAIGFILLQSQGMRTQIFFALPIGMALLLAGRMVNRRWLVRRRLAGAFVSRAVVVGERDDVAHVVGSIRRNNALGYQIVGVTLPDDVDALTVGTDTIPAIGTPDQVHIVAAQLSADAVIVASTPSTDKNYLKRLSWQLEGAAAELVVSSPIADVAGPRMALRSVEGMPLLQVEIPTFEGSRYAIKRGMDVVLSSLALVVVALVTPIIAIAIKADGGGPVFFRQTRIGRDGREFGMVKFRTMRADAEAMRETLLDRNEACGPLFKIKNDPRVTRVGAFLRRHSLDELPQFWNVLLGDMSIVGPRPPLPTEVTDYNGTVYRRLYIKPGITGLWQTSGRSNLGWDDALRLDLRYVENWSVIGDLLILWRTVGAVIHGRGAY